MEPRREEIYWALVAGGVDNWQGYEYANELAKDETGQPLFELSAEDQLIYLEAAGVDNWEWYDQSLEPLRQEYEEI